MVTGEQPRVQTRAPAEEGWYTVTFGETGSDGSTLTFAAPVMMSEGAVLDLRWLTGQGAHTEVRGEVALVIGAEAITGEPGKAADFRGLPLLIDSRREPS